MSKAKIILLLIVVAGVTGARADGAADRLFWVKTMERIADPVVTRIAAGTLVGSLRERPGARTNAYRHLECVPRTFNGILPFMNLPDDDTYEGRLRKSWRPSNTGSWEASAISVQSPSGGI